MTYVYEVHAVGMYGPHGGGIADARRHARIDILEATLGEGIRLPWWLYRASADIIDAVRSYAPGYLHHRAAARDLLRGDRPRSAPKTSSWERERHQDRAARVKAILNAAGCR